MRRVGRPPRHGDAWFDVGAGTGCVSRHGWGHRRGGSYVRQPQDHLPGSRRRQRRVSRGEPLAYGSEVECRPTDIGVSRVERAHNAETLSVRLTMDADQIRLFRHGTYQSSRRSSKYSRQAGDLLWELGARLYSPTRNGRRLETRTRRSRRTCEDRYQQTRHRRQH